MVCLFRVIWVDGHTVPQPPFQRHGADISPALVQALCGVLDGVILSITAACVLIVQKHVTQGEHRRHPLSVQLNVTLQVLNTHICLTFFTCLCI